MYFEGEFASYSFLTSNADFSYNKQLEWYRYENKETESRILLETGGKR